jgi:hypothetical protein
MANAIELAITVQNNGVTEPIVQLDLHDGLCKVFGVGMYDGFHRSKAGHTTACN